MNFKVEAYLPSDMKIPVPHAYIGNIQLSKGDDISIKEHSDPDSIGKIQDIFWDCKEGVAKILIRWFFKPYDTHDTFIVNSCSEIELFMSDSYMEIELPTVNGKVRVLTLDELINMEDIEDDDIYFSRAEWRHETAQLEPPLNKWRTACICKSVINPDIPFKVCPSCSSYFHVKCLEMSTDSSCISCGTEL